MRELTKKVFAAVLSASILVSGIISLSGCSKKKQGEPGKDGQTPFIGENGNWWIGEVDTGVLAAARNGIDGKDGADGRDAVTPRFHYNSNTGHLMISHDNGESWMNLINIENIVSAGIDGKDGISISSCEINADGELVILYSDGRVENLGVIVAEDGKDGNDGANGVGISEITLDDGGNLAVKLTDGTLLPLGNIKGKDGVDGEDGIVPLIKIDENNSWCVSYDDGKTWEVVGVSASGNDGADGKDGADGEDGITPRLKIDTASGKWCVSYDNGKTWDELGVSAEGKDGIDGKDGEDGKDGITPILKIDTASGNWHVSYDKGATWKDLGVKAIGSDGEPGADGKDGKDGSDGAPGKDGKDGEDGKDGRGIVRTEIVDGYLYVWYTDGTSQNVGKISIAVEGGSSVTDVYEECLEFYPLNGGAEYGVKIGRAMYLSVIVIPSYYNGKPVTTILDSAFVIPDCPENVQFESIVIPETVTEIQDFAFDGCPVESIVIPKSVMDIGYYAFGGINVQFEITEEEAAARGWDLPYFGAANIEWKK